MPYAHEYLIFRSKGYICLPIEAIAYFPSIVKLLLKIKLWKLGVFGIWQL